MIAWIILLLVGLTSFGVGLACGQRGWFCDGRTDRLKSEEAALMDQLRFLISTGGGYYSMLAMEKLKTNPDKVAYRLQKVRQQLILLGETSLEYPPSVLKLLQERQSNQV